MAKKGILIILLALILGCIPAVYLVESNSREYAFSSASLDESYAISSNLYGIFIEDINYAVDGGLNANLIQNNSFEYSFFNGAKDNKIEYAKSKFWELDDACRTVTESPIAKENPTSLKITLSGGVSTIYNVGYGEIGKESASIPMSAGETYGFAVYVLGNGFEGNLSVSVVTEEGQPLTTITKMEIAPIASYKRYEREITALTSGNGKLKIEVSGSGTLYLDTFTLRSTTSYGYGKEEWGESSVRLDLFNALKDLNPSFLRFPGGCLAEGAFTWENDYDWKSTVGSNEKRVQIPNLWGYFQSMEIGFYEYFLLSEALGATPVPVIGAGVLCQARGGGKYPLEIESEQFEAIVNNAIDLVEFANGDENTLYGSLRASMGHPEPFNMKYLAVGNENWGEEYYSRFEVIYNALKAKYPEIVVVSSSGPKPSGEEYDYNWNVVREKFADTVVDEHYYVGSGELESFYSRYDEFPRTTGVFVGEYASHSDYFVWWDMVTRNNWDSALSEGAFLTGIERNGDIVEMATYAPLLSKYGYHVWAPDLLWFDTHDVVLTPNYYVQYLNMNYVGDEYLPLIGKQRENGLYSSLTINRAEGKAYLKVVNTSNSAITLKADLTSLGELGNITKRYIRNNNIKIYNDINKERIGIESEVVITNESVLNDFLPKYSYTVFEIDFN